MKKVWISIAASAMLLSVTAGCSSGANVKSSGNEASGTVDKAKKDITLKLSIWGDDNRKRVFEDLGKKFTEKHPNIKVEVMLIPYAEYPKKMSIMVASRTVPDVAWLYDAIIPQLRDSDQLLDLADLSKDAAYDLNDIYASNMDIYRKNGKLYGIPFSAGPKVLFYNKKLFQEKGLKTPNELAKEGKWTYDELIKTAKALTDPSKGIYGVKFGDGSNWKDALTDTIWSFGADIFNEDGSKFLLNSPEGEKVFQMYDDMMFKDFIHPKPGDQLPFESGKIGMYRGTFSYSASARKAEGLEFDIAPMPKGPKADAPFYNGVSGYSVMKDSEHHAEAIELLKFFTNKEGIKALQSTFPPTRKSVLESAEFANLNAQPSAEGIKLAMSQPMMAGGRIIPTPTNWQQIDSKMQSMLDMLYTRNASVKQMLDRMEKEVTPLLK